MAVDKNAYFLLRNTHELKIEEAELEFEIKETENIEGETIKTYKEQNPSDFNQYIPQLIDILSTEKQEGETIDSFTGRLSDEFNKILILK